MNQSVNKPTNKTHKYNTSCGRCAVVQRRRTVRANLEVVENSPIQAGCRRQTTIEHLRLIVVGFQRQFLLQFGRRWCAVRFLHTAYCMRCYLAPGRAAKYCDERVGMYICLFVRMSARVSQNPHVQTSHFLYILTVPWLGPPQMTTTPVLWMTSCWHIMGHG